MNTFIRILEEKLVPIAAWIQRNKYINGIRRSFIQLMPPLMIGSIFLMIQSFPLPAYQNLMAKLLGENWTSIFDIPVMVTYSMLGLYVSFFVGQQLGKQFELDSSAVGFLSLISFLILTPLAHTEEHGLVITFDWLGSKGMFMAMIVGVFTTLVFRFFITRKITLKMPDGVPPEVIRSFEALTPAAAILSLALLIRVLVSKTPFGTVHDFIYTVLALPLKSLGTSFIGAILTVLSISVLWSVGINSGGMVNGIVRPFWLENQVQNIEALKAGQELPHIITEQFFDLIWMGGAGATLSLLLAIVIFARSKHLKTIGQISLVPGVFNINEPILFGLPVILNPIMLIPFNIIPVIMVIVQYTAMSMGLVSKPLGIAFPWPTPAIISGFITVGDISGSIIQIVNLLIGAMIYLPFLRIIDKASRLLEAQEHSQNSEN